MTYKLMLETYPKHLGDIDIDKLADCIAACFECAQVCTACADACLSEDMVAELTKCIRTNLDCADQCATTGRALSRHTGYDANLTRAFLEACAAECDHHAQHYAHCHVSAAACHRAYDALRAMMGGHHSLMHH